MTYNKNKIRKTLTRVRNSKLPSDFEEMDEIMFLLRKTHMNGEVRYWIKDSFKPQDDPDIQEEIPKYYQVIVKGEVDIVDDYKVNIENIQKVVESEVSKCKEDVKDMVIQIFRIAFPSKSIQNNKVVDLNRENLCLSNSNIRPLERDDIKITTLWKDSTAMHVAKSTIGKDYLFKVGVNWEFWHSKSNTSRLKTLIHEVVHFTHSHHRKSFFLEHARGIQSISSSEDKKKYIEENVICGDINWNKLKTLAMRGVHQQPDEIDISGHQNRREACNSIVEEMEEILNYNYSVGTTFHTNPPYREHARMRSEWSHSEVSEEVDNVKLGNLNFEKKLSDKEMYKIMEEKMKEEDGAGFKWVYKREYIPRIDENCNVFQNDWFAEMISKMVNNPDSISEDEVKEDVTVPVVRE